jgi:hypothetical protein
MQLIKSAVLVILGFALSAMALPEVVPDSVGAVERRDTVSTLYESGACVETQKTDSASGLLGWKVPAWWMLRRQQGEISSVSKELTAKQADESTVHQELLRVLRPILRLRDRLLVDSRLVAISWRLTRWTCLEHRMSCKRRDGNLEMTRLRCCIGSRTGLCCRHPS